MATHPSQITAGKPYFYLMPFDMYFACFATEAERDAAAAAAIRECLDCGEWMEEVENIIVGQITGRAQECDIVEREGELDEDGLDEAGQYWPSSDYDYGCMYSVQPLPELKEAQND